MGQVLNGCATTTAADRRAIYQSGNHLKYFILCAGILVANAAWAQGLPLPRLDDPQLQALIDKFPAALAEMEKSEFFEHPQQPPAFECDIDEATKLQMAGTYYNNPVAEKAFKDAQREVARSMRAQGLDSVEMTMPVDSNFKFTPLAITCSNGKPEGAYTYIASLDRAMSQASSMVGTDSTSIVKNSSSMASFIVQRGTFYISGGAVEKRQEFYQLTQTKVVSLSEDERLNKVMKRTDKDVNAELNKPQFQATYISNDGTMVTILPTSDYTVKSGLLYPSVKKISSILTSIIRPTGEDRREQISYIGTRLQGRTHTKGNRMHGPAVTYMENIYKKLGQPLAGQIGMEDSREVVMDGADMIENTMCYQNGVIVKMTPCPMD